MLPHSILQSLNLSSPDDIKTAQNLWKMLDQMADSSPQTYDKFISKNLKQGIEEIKQDKQKKQEPLKIIPNVGFMLELSAVLKEEQRDKNRTSEMFKVADQKESWEKVREKFKGKVQIYLNVCFSDRVLLPLDKDNNEITELTTASMSKIVSIPYSLQSPLQDKVSVYYLLVLNSQVFNGLKKMNPTYLINMVCSLLQERMRADRNPLFSAYNPREYPDRKAYYEIVKESIRMSKEVGFKYGELKQPEKVLLQPGADKQQSLDVNQGRSKEEIKFKETKVEDVKLPDIKFSKQSPPFEQKAEPKQEPTTIPKKILIEELSETFQPDNLIPYTLVKGEKEFKIEFLVPGISSIKELELDVNVNCIRVNVPRLQKSRQIDLDFGVNVEIVKAKYLKKEGKLSVILPFK